MLVDTTSQWGIRAVFVLSRHNIESIWIGRELVSDNVAITVLKIIIINLYEITKYSMP